MVALGESGTHAIVAAELGPLNTGERELAEGCCPLSSEDMLVCSTAASSASTSSPRPPTGADVLFRCRRQPETAHPATPPRRLLPVGDHPRRGRRTSHAGRSAVAGRDTPGGDRAGRRVPVTDRDAPANYRLITTIPDWRGARRRPGRRLPPTVGIRDRLRRDRNPPDRPLPRPAVEIAGDGPPRNLGNPAGPLRHPGPHGRGRARRRHRPRPIIVPPIPAGDPPRSRRLRGLSPLTAMATPPTAASSTKSSNTRSNADPAPTRESSNATAPATDPSNDHRTEKSYTTAPATVEIPAA